MSSATTQGRLTGGTDETNAAHLALGVLAPLATVALAYGLWFVSDRLLYIAPLDRAAFGWAVVVPVWALAPVAAAFAWRRLTPRGITMAAAALGLIVGGLAAVCCGRRSPSRIASSEPSAARSSLCRRRSSSGSSSAPVSALPACFQQPCFAAGIRGWQVLLAQDQGWRWCSWRSSRQLSCCWGRPASGRRLADGKGTPLEEARTMRSVLALAASALAGLAAVIASLGWRCGYRPVLRRTHLPWRGGGVGCPSALRWTSPDPGSGRGSALALGGDLDRRSPTHVHHGLAGVVSPARPGSGVPWLDRDGLSPARALWRARPFDRERLWSGRVVCRQIPTLGKANRETGSVTSSVRLSVAFDHTSGVADQLIRRHRPRCPGPVS